MAIKRFTIELDDAADRISPTSVPESLAPKKAQDLKLRESTALPTDESTEDRSLNAAAIPRQKIVGRTIADLVADFANDPRAMATILMFMPIVPFAKKMNAIEDLILPGSIGILLNIVWFGVSLIVKKR